MGATSRTGAAGAHPQQDMGKRGTGMEKRMRQMVSVPKGRQGKGALSFVSLLWQPIQQ